MENNFWRIKPTPAIQSIKKLSKKFNIPPILAAILLQNGINTSKKVRQYFHLYLKNLYDPFLMHDMHKAIDRLIQALDSKENILLYGDYDVDGVTSIALTYQFLKQLYSNIQYYIPDRNLEGYGISQQGILWAKENNIDLIISFDCGIRAIHTVALAKKYAIDVIITDHHNPGDFLPPAYAIVNPKQRLCGYPFKGLSGCGIAFKLLHALCIKKNIPQQNLYAYIDLVAISTAADIVPIIDENRILVHYGLLQLDKKPSSVGLAALAKIAGLCHPITVSQIVFQLAPRINAPGRIAHAKVAVELLLSQDKSIVSEQVAAINLLNTKRRKIDTKASKEALNRIENEKTRCTNILIDQEWCKGILGIVAARCVDRYSKPTIIFTSVDDKAIGSARSVPGFNIYEAIVSCEDLLDQYGGHAYAAGITMPIDNIPIFKEKFEAIVKKEVQKKQLTPILDISLVVDIKNLNPKLYYYIQKMAPFGPENMQPVFVTYGVQAASWSIIKEKHLKIHFHLKKEGYLVEGIGFGMANYVDIIKGNKFFNIAFTLEKNDFLGENHIQVNIKDIQF